MEQRQYDVLENTKFLRNFCESKYDKLNSKNFRVNDSLTDQYIFYNMLIHLFEDKHTDA